MGSSVGTRWIAIFLLLAATLAFPGAVRAQGIVYGDEVPAGVTVDHDVLLVGQNVSLAGNVNGNVLILANQVSISGRIDGSLILIAQNAVVSGTISGAAYGLALTLELAPTASLQRDLYISTVSLVSNAGSTIGRDLFAVSLDAGLSGQIGRQPHTAIGPIQLYNGLMQLLGFNELTVKLHIDLPPHPAVLPTPTAHPRRLVPQPAAFGWSKWGLSVVRDWIVLSLFGLLLWWLARPRLARVTQPLLIRPWRSLAIGLLAIVLAVNLFGVGLLLAILVFCIGLSFNYIGLWQLSIALWIACYSALALAMVALWFYLVFGTKIVLASVIARALPTRLSSARAWLEPLSLVLALLLYTMLRSVPSVGWVIGVLVTATGLGATWLSFRAAATDTLTPALPEPVSSAPVNRVLPPPLKRSSSRAKI